MIKKYYIYKKIRYPTKNLLKRCVPFVYDWCFYSFCQVLLLAESELKVFISITKAMFENRLAR